MSRLDSFIRRLSAQRDCLDHLVALLGERPGPVLELGLGNGRTFDHLRDRMPGRRIVVIERAPDPHPACWPPDGDLIVGNLEDALPTALTTLGEPAVLVHSDIGTGEPERNARVAGLLSQLLPPLLAEAALIASDQALNHASLVPLPAPGSVASDRYFLYRKS